MYKLLADKEVRVKINVSIVISKSSPIQWFTVHLEIN